MDLRIDVLNANDAIQGALDSVTSLIDAAGAEVIYPRHPAQPSVRGSADRLRQVLINLLSNAVKYNVSDRPQISIRVTVNETTVWIDVVDNGGGVTRDDAAMIFEKFARGSRADRAQGAGLGLPISRAIMRAMGGDLTVEFQSDASSFFRARLARAE